MKFTSSALFYFFASAAVATAKGSGVCDCNGMQGAYDDALSNVLAFDDLAILEHFCNGFDRQKTINFIKALDASRLDECELSIFGPIIDNKDEVLFLLADEYTCKGKIESELASMRDGQYGRKLTSTTLLGALTAANEAATSGDEQSADKDTVNVGFCQDYFTLGCDENYTSDCAMIESLYSSENNGANPNWSKPPVRKLREGRRSLASSPPGLIEECNHFTGKTKGHCIAFFSIREGSCCEEIDQVPCLLLKEKIMKEEGSWNVCPLIPNGQTNRMILKEK